MFGVVLRPRFPDPGFGIGRELMQAVQFPEHAAARSMGFGTYYLHRLVPVRPDARSVHSLDVQISPLECSAADLL